MTLFRGSTSPRQLWRMLTAADRIGVAAAMAAQALLLIWGVSLTETLLLALLAGSVVAIAICDLRHRIIPDLISGGLGLGGAAFAALRGADTLMAHGATAAVAMLVLLALRAGHARLRQRTGLGLGDVKLMAAAALWVGPWYLANYVLVAALSALTVALIGRTGDDPRGLPFGVPLALWLWVFAAYMALTGA